MFLIIFFTNNLLTGWKNAYIKHIIGFFYVNIQKWVFCFPWCMDDYTCKSDDDMDTFRLQCFKINGPENLPEFIIHRKADNFIL